MFINLNIYPSIILGIILFFLSYYIALKMRDKRKFYLIFTIFLLFCIPSFLIDAYYFHLVAEPAWYVRFRSIRGIEILSCMWGLPAGSISGKAGDFLKNNSLRNISQFLIFCLSLVLILIPFIKPIVLPVKPHVDFQDKWVDGVCIQSGGSTCGPACLATILSMKGMRKSEEEIAANVYSSSSGTENWYMIRYAGKLGLKVHISNESSLEKIKVPSIIGTKLGNIGHFVVLLDVKDDKYIVGDPLKGRLELNKEEFLKRYKYKNFALTFYYDSQNP